MEFLNPQIARLAKVKKTSLLRKQMSCGIFQEIEPLKRYSSESDDNRKS